MEQEQSYNLESGNRDIGENHQRDSKNLDDIPQSRSPNALKTIAAECLGNWIYYLQMVNTLCSAGVKLAQSLSKLAELQNISLATQCQASWEDLLNATVYATHTVKTHIAMSMKGLSIAETYTEADAQRQLEHNQHIVAENFLTFINLQYQFSIASCECMGPMAMCPSCQTNPGGQHDPDCSMALLQQCFAQLFNRDTRSHTSSPHLLSDRNTSDSPKANETRGSPYHEPFRGPSPVHHFTHYGETIRGPFPNPGQLHTMKSPFSRGCKSPLQFPLFPLAGQRRWSEAAAPEVNDESGDGTMRRWSMPWDCCRVEPTALNQRCVPAKLTVPNPGMSQERSRSTTPELAPTQPGTLTSGEGLAEAIQLLSCRPMKCAIPQGSFSNQFMQSFGAASWLDSHDDKSSRRTFQRGVWQSVDVPPHSSGMPVTEHYDIFPPPNALTSRKSSSSTDSSCLSIHSRSASASERGSDGTNSSCEGVRMHANVYSIWSGSDHLPFIRLPESQEPPDDSENDSNEQLFVKPT